MVGFLSGEATKSDQPFSIEKVIPELTGTIVELEYHISEWEPSAYKTSKCNSPGATTNLQYLPT